MTKEEISQTDVYITGMGIVSSIGKSCSEFSKSLKNGISGIGYLNSESNDLPNVGAKLKDFSFKDCVDEYLTYNENLAYKAKKCAYRSPLGLQTSVVAALEAWKQAKLSEKPIDSERLGVIVCGNNINQRLQFDLHGKFNHAPEYITPTYALQYMDTDHVGTLTEIFEIRGEGFTVGAASASGNVGVLRAYELIKSGAVDCCMAVGALTDLSPVEIQGFYNVGAMGGKKFCNQPDKACRPFDKEHEGFIYGQASACLILESSKSILNRKTHALCQILGGSMVLDGNRLADPSEQGEIKSMKKALKRSGIEIDKVDYINTHGTSSPLGDDTELKAIRAVLGNRISKIWINSTKPLTGHCLCSAGVVELIATVIQMKGGFIHPNLNLDNPIDSQVGLATKESVNSDINIALSNSFGFGGFNSTIILKNSVNL